MVILANLIGSKPFKTGMLDLFPVHDKRDLSGDDLEVKRMRVAATDFMCREMSDVSIM